MHGGEIVAAVLKNQGVQFLFTLCGGHISPVLVACRQSGVRVIDTRHEATAVFAADAVARLTGIPGVAAVTAGPGVTNTITAVQNARLAQSPVVLLGGAVPTALRGRGALQDIDQLALMRPLVKSARRVTRLRDLAPALENAFRLAQEGVPGPVFVELPIDLLYPEAAVRQMYGVKAAGEGRAGRSLAGRFLTAYLRLHVERIFSSQLPSAAPRLDIAPPQPGADKVRAAAARLAKARRPLLLVGSQCTLDVANLPAAVQAIERLGIPVYLSGMARGLLGRDHPLQLRHKRREALKEADLVLLAGVPCDFRLDYGRAIRGELISANRSRADLTRNRRPQLAILGDPSAFLRKLAGLAEPGALGVGNGGAINAGRQLADLAEPAAARWDAWLDTLRARDALRSAEIERLALAPAAHLNPLHLLGEIEASLPSNAIVVADGGDFVGTASYIVRPRAPLGWLDPGAFGALGVGAGFALGAKLCRPEAEVWLLYGDGAAGFSLAEFDTFARHGLPVIAVVGNDAGWNQIAREQVEMFGDAVGTALAHADYHLAVQGLGGVGIRLADPELIPDALDQARQSAALGKPVLINAILDKTDFRKGSISM